MPPQLRQLVCGRRLGMLYIRIGFTLSGVRFGGALSVSSRPAEVRAVHDSPVRATPVKATPPRKPRRVTPPGECSSAVQGQQCACGQGVVGLKDMAGSFPVIKTLLDQYWSAMFGRGMRRGERSSAGKSQEDRFSVGEPCRLRKDIRQGTTYRLPRQQLPRGIDIYGLAGGWRGSRDTNTSCAGRANRIPAA